MDTPAINRDGSLLALPSFSGLSDDDAQSSVIKEQLQSARGPFDALDVTGLVKDFEERNIAHVQHQVSMDCAMRRMDNSVVSVPYIVLGREGQVLEGSSGLQDGRRPVFMEIHDVSKLRPVLDVLSKVRVPLYGLVLRGNGRSSVVTHALQRIVKALGDRYDQVRLLDLYGVGDYSYGAIRAPKESKQITIKVENYQMSENHTAIFLSGASDLKGVQIFLNELGVLDDYDNVFIERVKCKALKIHELKRAGEYMRAGNRLGANQIMDTWSMEDVRFLCTQRTLGSYRLQAAKNSRKSVYFYVKRRPVCMGGLVGVRMERSLAGDRFKLDVLRKQLRDSVFMLCVRGEVSNKCLKDFIEILGERYDDIRLLELGSLRYFRENGVCAPASLRSILLCDRQVDAEYKRDVSTFLWSVKDLDALELVFHNLNDEISSAIAKECIERAKRTRELSKLLNLTMRGRAVLHT